MEWPLRPKKAKALPEGATFGEMWPEADSGVLHIGSIDGLLQNVIHR